MPIRCRSAPSKYEDNPWEHRCKRALFASRIVSNARPAEFSGDFEERRLPRLLRRLAAARCCTGSMPSTHQSGRRSATTPTHPIA